MNPNYVNTTTGMLWARWSQWRVDDGAQEIPQKAFAQTLDRKGYPARRTKIGAIRVGLTLAEEDS